MYFYLIQILPTLVLIDDLFILMSLEHIFVYSEETPVNYNVFNDARRKTYNEDPNTYNILFQRVMRTYEVFFEWLFNYNNKYHRMSFNQILHFSTLSFPWSTLHITNSPLPPKFPGFTENRLANDTVIHNSYLACYRTRTMGVLNQQLQAYRFHLIFSWLMNGSIYTQSIIGSGNCPNCVGSIMFRKHLLVRMVLIWQHDFSSFLWKYRPMR